jgi:small subunit ribosomal protein S20
MPNIQAAKKAMRQSAKRRVVNDNRRRAMKEAVKGIKKAITTGGKVAKEDIANAYQAIDKAVKRGVIKKNTGARKKSRLVAFIKGKSA